MKTLRFPLAAGILAAAAATWAPPAAAAESQDACIGFVDSVPAEIATQGTWCLRRDLTTAIASGSAITIATNNVTLDCNGFKLGGLAGGPATVATGIAAASRRNVTVRNCTVRGFKYGIELRGASGGGHLVEDNRVDQATAVGLWVEGDGSSIVRGNRIGDIGGNPDTPANGILAHGDVIGNTVVGVAAATANGSARGIALLGAGTRAHRNHVRGLVPQGSGAATGISAASQASIAGNHVASVPSVAGTGIQGSGACSHNQVQGFATAFSGCLDGGGNASQP